MLHDDGSDPATAVRLYEKLITQDKVDLVLGPFGSPITEAVANVAEKHKMPMVTHASTTSIFKKGRKFVFMVYPPAEVWHEGLIDWPPKGAQDRGHHQRGLDLPQSGRPRDHGAGEKEGPPGRLH